jgi:hypothetical protein
MEIIHTETETLAKISVSRSGGRWRVTPKLDLPGRTRDPAAHTTASLLWKWARGLTLKLAIARLPCPQTPAPRPNTRIPQLSTHHDAGDVPGNATRHCVHILYKGKPAKRGWQCYVIAPGLTSFRQDAKLCPRGRHASRSDVFPYSKPIPSRRQRGTPHHTSRSPHPPYRSFSGLSLRFSPSSLIRYSRALSAP